MKQFICLLVMAIFLFGCEKKDKTSSIITKYDGNYTFTTRIHSYMGSLENDSVIIFDGKIKGKENNVLEIVYGPGIKVTTTNTGYAPIICEGIIYPTVDKAGFLTYPEYTKQDPHYSFPGTAIGDSGKIEFNIGYNGLSAGYYNHVVGVRK